MTKNDLIKYVADATQFSKKDAEQSVDAVLAGVSDALLRGEKVDLRGFGNLQVNEKKERQGRNPKTGEAITIAARRVAVFKPSKELTERLNSARAEPTSGGAVAEPSEASAKLHGDKIGM
jgi:integration host factor alpha subunit